MVGAATMAANVLVSSIWAVVLLDRTPTWGHVLRPAILTMGVTASVLLVIWGQPARNLAGRTARAVAAVLAGVAVLAGPALTAWLRRRAALGGPSPRPGRPRQGGGGFPGGGRLRRRVAPSPGGGRSGPGGTGTGRGFAQGGVAHRHGSRYHRERPLPRWRIPSGFPGGKGRRRAGGAWRSSTPASRARPSPRLSKPGAKTYSWVAAVVGANDAAGYQLDFPVTGHGYRGVQRDGPGTLVDRVRELRQGEEDPLLHILGLVRAGANNTGGTSDDASQITSWVESNFTATTIGGATVYDLSGGMPTSTGGRA